MTSSARLYTGRIIEVFDVSPDVRKLFVEIENKQRLPFNAGQYVYLSVPEFEARAFSIASAPHETFLEFHIKNSGHGLSAHIVEKLKPGHTLNLSGPMGRSHLRLSGRPLLALAGGLGVAPMKSIIEASLQERTGLPIHLYWGARLQGQLYLDDHFRMLAKKHDRLSYIPVLSEDDDHPRYRRGLVTAALAENFGNLGGMDIYLAGPSAMVEATLPFLMQLGAEEDHIFSDNLTL